jgi:hypothetical protein
MPALSSPTRHEVAFFSSGAISLVLGIGHVLSYYAIRTFYNTSVILYVILVAVVPMGATAMMLVVLYNVVWPLSTALGK